MELFAQPLWGIVPPMLTPLANYDELDCPGLERLIEHILAGGISGLFLLGTTGEGSMLSYEVRRELVKRACRQIAGRVPVLVGITDTAFSESVRMGRYAGDHGANAVVVTAPFIMTENQAELRQYLQHLLAEMPLPVFLYHMPPLTKSGFDLETLRWAIDQPRIVGFKDSSGSMIHLQQVCGLLPLRPAWTILTGPEELLAQTVLMGGHGGVSGGANLFPKLYVALYEAARRGDLPRARALQAKVLNVVSRLYRLDPHSTGVIKGLKCALSCLGICGETMAEPFRPLGADLKHQVREAIQELKPLLSTVA